eukprot:1481585-Rhodomonas_salina.4
MEIGERDGVCGGGDSNGERVCVCLDEETATVCVCVCRGGRKSGWRRERARESCLLYTSDAADDM